jgi:hypothetical protein
MVNIAHENERSNPVGTGVPTKMRGRLCPETKQVALRVAFPFLLVPIMFEVFLRKLIAKLV